MGEASEGWSDSRKQRDFVKVINVCVKGNAAEEIEERCVEVLPKTIAFVRGESLGPDFSVGEEENDRDRLSLRYKRGNLSSPP